MRNKCAEYIDNILSENGKISLYNYMNICLHHKDFGYYVNAKNPLGAKGDFITAPEISQIFGEMIGIFILNNLDNFFGGNEYGICELGAGNGTLIQDISRALGKKTPQIYILEQSKILRKRQKDKIPNIIHIDKINDLPDISIFFIANEFFDALPIRAYVADKEITIKKQGNKYVFNDFIKDNIKETCPEADMFINQIAKHITINGGAGLICDYGYLSSDKLTFRGFKNHTVTDGLTDCGQCDLTADVDFVKLQNIIKDNGLPIFNILTQKDFLTKMGGEIRLENLLNNYQKKNELTDAYNLLVDIKQMGERFKFMLIYNEEKDIYPFS